MTRRMEQVAFHARLTAAEPELLKVLKAIEPFIGRWHERTAQVIGEMYDQTEEKFSLEEAGFFQYIEEARNIREGVRAVIAKIEKGENMATVTVTKRAWIRNNVPPGTSAPGHISCPCGQAPESRHAPTQGDIHCPCGTIYTWNGWVKESPAMKGE